MINSALRIRGGGGQKSNEALRAGSTGVGESEGGHDHFAQHIP